SILAAVSALSCRCGAMPTGRRSFTRGTGRGGRRAGEGHRGLAGRAPLRDRRTHPGDGDVGLFSLSLPNNEFSLKICLRSHPVSWLLRQIVVLIPVLVLDPLPG